MLQNCLRLISIEVHAVRMSRALGEHALQVQVKHNKLVMRA